jgi:hypothetical protein
MQAMSAQARVVEVEELTQTPITGRAFMENSWTGAVAWCAQGVSIKVDSAPRGTRYRGARMKWFMRLTDRGVGIHMGILPGYPASHGCIRLPAYIAPLDL